MITSFHSLLPLLNETLQRKGLSPSLFDGHLPSASKITGMPVDIYEDDAHYHFIFEIPGVPKDQIKIEFHEGILTVSAEKKREDRTLPLQRKFKLPADAQADSASATLQDGLLTLSFAKVAKPQPKQITIA